MSQSISSTSDKLTSLTDVLNCYKIPLPHWQRAFGPQLSDLRSCRLACRITRDLCDLFPETVHLEVDWQSNASAAKGRFLERLKRLSSLGVYGRRAHVSAVLLQPFLLALQPCTLSNLKQLSLHNLELSKFSVAVLARMANLETLFLFDCCFACASGLAALAKCSRLDQITLNNTHSRSCTLDSIIQSLTAVRSLKVLQICDFFQHLGFPGAALGTLTQLVSLECTQARGNKQVSKLATNSGNESHLSSLTNLRHLCLPEGDFDQLHAALIALTSLTSLSMSSIQEADLSAISTSGMQLQQLTIRGCAPGNSNWVPPDSLHTLVYDCDDVPSYSFLLRTAASAAGLTQISFHSPVCLDIPNTQHFWFLTEIGKLAKERAISLVCREAVLWPNMALGIMSTADVISGLAAELADLPAFTDVYNAVIVQGLGAITADLCRALRVVFPTMQRLVLLNCDVSGLDASALLPLLSKQYKLSLELVDCIGDTDSVQQLWRSLQP